MEIEKYEHLDYMKAITKEILDTTIVEELIRIAED